MSAIFEHTHPRSRIEPRADLASTIKTQMRAAHRDGETLGMKLGYIEGHRWGFVSGACFAGCCVVVAKLLGWL